MSAESFYARFDFFPCRMDEIRSGDLLANHGTVTRVIKGKRKHHDEWLNVERGQVLVKCGKSFSVKSTADHIQIIGRLRPPAVQS